MDVGPEDQAPKPTQRWGRRPLTTEFAATILLAFASVVTSWSGYQASLWSGIQATNYNRANALRVESTRESTMAGLVTGLDIALFMAWFNARSTGNYADSYVLGTVVFAPVLFFCGVVSQFSDLRLRVVLLGMGVFLLLFGLSKILVLPRAA